MSHGLSGSRTTQSGTCRDFASHGYIVFALSHHCGTANYSCKRNGEEKYWTSMQDHRSIELRRSQIKYRREEIKQLIDDISDPKFCQQVLGFGPEVSLDLDKLIMAGHSFGGMTAIDVALHDERVKAIWTFDPWLWCIHEDITQKKVKIKQPMTHVLSGCFSPFCEEYYGFDTEALLKTLIECGESHAKEFVIINEINHYHQCDAIVIMPLETFLASKHKLQLNGPALYLLNSQLVLRFLKNLGFANFPRQVVEDQIKKLEERYVNY